MIINNFHKVLDQYNSHHKNKLSLRKLAWLTNSPIYSITALYNGKSKGIKFDVLDKLIKFFNVPMTDFISYQSGALNLYLMNASDFLPKLKLSNKSSKFLDNSLILTDSKHRYTFMFTVASIFFHRYDVDLANIASKPTRLVNDLFKKAGTMIDRPNVVFKPTANVTISNLFLGNEPTLKAITYMTIILSELPKSFRQYLLIRLLLHSKKLSKTTKPYRYNFFSARKQNDCKLNGVYLSNDSVPAGKLSKLVKWQKIQSTNQNRFTFKHLPQIKNRKCYFLITKSKNRRINLIDSTTNNFK